MGRKKKKEEPEIYHTPFGSTTIPPYPEIDLSPYTIETTSLGDSQRRFITTTHPGTSITYTGSVTGEEQTIYYPPQHWEPYSSTIGYGELMRQLGKEEEAKVKVNLEKFKGKYVCCVRETLDLLPERILITLSAVKGRLMMEVAPIHIKEFQCSMTPAVRKNIIQASKRARMYGKKMPIIARFDEYGNELPEQIEINDAPGVNIRILDPADYGELYFEMVAIEFPSNDYTVTRDASWFSSDSLFSPDDIPF
ncbi:MAG: hypothetical protein II393_03775 [Cytophagales bacterium]|nr:hypothetical protein [Cytophagales bacterium]